MKISDFDLYLYNEGKHQEAYNIFGAHITKEGTKFTLYAPNAKYVSVIGDFNNWDALKNPMEKIDDCGIFSIVIKEAKEWERYRYMILTKDERTIFKSDPYAFFSDNRPENCSKVYNLEGYVWHDSDFIKNRNDSKDEPVAIYEMHLGSWMKKPDGSFNNYNELPDLLIPYLKKMGFNYVEFLPVIEHPLDESWGYQGTGYYSVTSRYGTPKDFMYLIDRLHEANIKVILDWVPSHIAKDSFGLYQFDGTYLYDYNDDNIRENKVWGTINLDLGKGSVQSFLISNALFYMKYFHVDGFRIDAVSNIIYYLGDQNFGTNYGGIDFLKKLSTTIKEKDNKVLLFAEDSTIYPNITRKANDGGIGFDYKWNMGWMNDTLKYFSYDPIYRSYHHDLITFGLVYAFSERFILPLSHDEVVHGKRSLIDKMPGDYFQKFANYRTLLGLMFTHPGKKLLFMGGEFAQFHEWRDKEELDWFLLTNEMHKKAQDYVSDLLKIYKSEPSLFELDDSESGFRWIDSLNNNQSIFSYIRYGIKENEMLIVVLNMTPNTYQDYLIGVPKKGKYKEILNSDLEKYGGSNLYNGLVLKSTDLEMHKFKQSIKMTIGPLCVSILKYEGK